jgi:outer membrane protein assembly factor BamB
MSDTQVSKSTRWWPLYLIGALITLACLVIWVPDSANRQLQVMKTMGLVLVGLLSTLIWFFGLSRLSSKIRLRGLAVLAGLIVLAMSLFQFRGFTGDLVPNIAWRWSSESFVSGDIPNTLNLLTNYPQFLGPNRNAKLTNIHIEPNWKQHPPKLLWKKSVGEAWSAFAVSDRFAITQEQHDEEETVVCYDLLTGKEQWQHKDSFRYENPMAGIGPRATPTISKNRVYTMGASGILNCLDLGTGQKIWSRNTLQDTQAKMQEWGLSCSPLILDNKVIVSPGGPNNQSLMAYHKDTGNIIWGGGSNKAGNSSPYITTLAQQDQIVIFNHRQVAGHHPTSGQLLWQHPWPNSQFVAQPVPLSDDRLFVSSGYGVGCQLIQIAQNEQGSFSATTLWKNNRLKAKFTNVVHKEGYIYGLDDGILVCLDIETGKRKWKRGRYGHGQLILVEDLLLIQTEHGDIVLVDATPESYNERASFPALTGRTWNNPTFAAPYLLVRNDQEAACFELTLK